MVIDPRSGRSRTAPDEVARDPDPALHATRFGALPTLTDAPTAPAAHARAPEEALDARFERVRLLGRGGVGAVWLARDKQLDRAVAVKVLQHVAQGALPSLLDEARATARVQHPNVVAVLDAGAIEGAAFVAFEYIEGTTLRARMRDEASRVERAPREALRLLRDVAAGLAAAHAVDVLHLDVKPENVLVGLDGRARVIDFGLARMRVGDACVPVSGAPSGTPAYMAPELWTGDGVCDGTDVWSFAVLAFELLAGRRPYEASSAADAMVQVLAEGGVRPPPLPGIHPDVVALLTDGLKRDRRTRPFMRDIEAALARALSASDR